MIRGWWGAADLIEKERVEDCGDGEEVRALLKGCSWLR